MNETDLTMAPEHEPTSAIEGAANDGKIPIADFAALTTPRLPFPRPPFDAARALAEIFDQESIVAELATIAERAKRAAKTAKDDWEAAVELLGVMIRHSKSEQAEASREPEQLTFTHGLECAWERENVGRVCGVCAEERERARLSREAAACTNGGGLETIDQSPELESLIPNPQSDEGHVEMPDDDEPEQARAPRRRKARK